MVFFKYSKEVKVDKKDEKGNKIPIVEKFTDEVGKITETPTGKFETELVVVNDYFNIDKLIRTHAISPTSIIVLLDDGHEVTEVVPKLKNKNHDPKKPVRPNDIVEEKQRIWVQSEIELKGEDIERFYKVLDLYSATTARIAQV